MDNNKLISRSIERLRELNKEYRKHIYDDDELEYLNNYATKYDVDQPFFRNSDVIEETISDLTKQPEWLQLILHDILVEFFEYNTWTVIEKHLKKMTDFNTHTRVHMFMNRMGSRAWEAKSRHDMAKKILKNYE